MSRAITSAVLPSLPVTAALPGPVSFASPSSTAILCFFIRNLTPFDNCAATLRDRFTTASRSKRRLSAASPNSLSLCIRCQISDERSSALVGMQPQLRQIPPKFSRSTTATDLPSWAARMAQT